jgi:hypothetical protein
VTSFGASGNVYVSKITEKYAVMLKLGVSAYGRRGPVDAAMNGVAQEFGTTYNKNSYQVSQDS